MTVRVGLVGCGFIGTVHAFALKALIGGGLADAAIAGLCDSDPDKAASLAGLLGDPQVFEDAGDLIDAVDAVWVCTPTSTHMDLVGQVAHGGKALYCEKPLATDLAGAEALLGMAERAGIPHQVGLVLRSGQGASVAAAVLRGELSTPGASALPALSSGTGRPMAAALRDDQYFPIQGLYNSTWRKDAEVSGGGTLIEHSIHDLDLLSWLLGPVESLTATTSSFAGYPGVEDVAVVTMVHESGASSSLLSVWHNVTSRSSTRRLEVFCEDAYIQVENEHVGPVHVETASGVADLPMSEDALEVLGRLDTLDELRPHLLSYAVADRSFLDALGEGRAPWPGLQVGVEAHRLADAAYRSAALGSVPTKPLS